MFLGSGLEQPFNLKKITLKHTELTVRVLLVSYWFLCIIINTIAKTKLLAYMVSTPTHHITIPELLDEEYEQVIDLSRGSFKFFDDYEEALLSKFSTTYQNNVCDFIDYTASHKSLIYGELPRISLHSKVLCSNSSKIGEKLGKLTTQTVGINAHAWPFNKDIPFVDQFNVHIGHIINGEVACTWIYFF